MTTMPATAEASAPFTTARLAAIGALGFTAGVFVQNAFLLIGMPDASAPASEAAAWFAANGARAGAASALVGVNLPLLLLFAASMRELGRERDAARRWIDLGTLGAVVLSGLFGVVAATQMAALLIAADGATPVFTALWALHNAAFAVAMSALGATLLGFALGAYAAGITPGWQRAVGVTGAALLLLAGLANVAVAGGSPIVYVGFGGFLLWLVWLASTGLRLLR